MSANRWMRWLPAMALAAAACAAPAAGAQDVGEQVEREWGVIDSRTEEGRAFNEQWQRVVRRVVAAITADPKYARFELRSAKILGGKSEKNDRILNAFALPDGRIYVTIGLMRAVQGSPLADDEVGFIAGHEFTHVVQKHSANQQKKALPAAVLAVLLGAATRNRTVGTVATAGAAAYVSSFSRKDEYRADKGGLLAIWNAGYNPDGAVEVLKRLKAAGGDQNKTLNGWFGSHPLAGNRIERLQQMIRDLRAGKSLEEKEDGKKERDG